MKIREEIVSDSMVSLMEKIDRYMTDYPRLEYGTKTTTLPVQRDGEWVVNVSRYRESI